VPTLTTLEPFLGFECNRKGCCCKQWFIAFEPDDLPRVLAAFDDDERDEAVKGWRFFVDEDDNSLTRFHFGLVGPDDTCQFLADDGRCGLQVAKGAQVLPHLCRAFPAYAHEGLDGVEVHFDPICPEVMRCITDQDGPVRLVEVEVEEGSELAVRGSRPLRVPAVSLGDQELTAEQLRRVRERIYDALGDATRPVLDRLAQIHYALARVAAGQPADSFAVRADDPVAAFDGWFDGCVAIHQGNALARLLHQYRRFVFDVKLDDDAPWGTLDAALAYDPRWRDQLDLRQPAWQRVLRRYLAYRFYSAFQRSPQAWQLSFTYGTVAHSLATAVRYAVGLARWLGRPVDRTLFKVALGASEYLYRTLRLPTSSMPWFLP